MDRTLPALVWEIPCLEHMPGDPYYSTPQWRTLRAQALARDGYHCTVPGCPDRATTVDHIRSRKRGGADVLHNLRSLCDHHDRTIKERPSGERGHSGRLFVHGVDVAGIPLDRNHHWAKP